MTNPAKPIEPTQNVLLSASKRRCEGCGKPMPGTLRADARAHPNPACRKAAQRKRRQAAGPSLDEQARALFTMTGTEYKRALKRIRKQFGPAALDNTCPACGSLTREQVEPPYCRHAWHAG